MKRVLKLAWYTLAALVVSHGVRAQVMNAGGTRPAVSPDGRYIAFNAARDGTWDVYVIGADGSDEHRITSVAERNFVNLGPPTWIGDRVMVWRRVNDTTRIELFDIGGRASAPSTSPAVTVPDDATQIRPSPDGRRIVFLHGDRRRPRVAVSNLDGSGMHNLTNGKAATNPAWSPDGKSVVFTLVDSGGTGQLAVASAVGGDTRAVTHVDPSEGLPLWATWSADGKRLAFQTGKYNRTNIAESSAHLWVADVGTGNIMKLMVHERPWLDETPAWFPDGSRIAFQSNRTGTLQVWTVKPDGTDPRQLTGGARSTSRP